MAEPLKLSVVPVPRNTPRQVAADLRGLADEIEREADGAGKFVLIRLRDSECEGAQDGEYTFAIDRSRMRRSEVVALLVAAQHHLLNKLTGGE